MAQTVKHLPTMRETWVQSLGWEDPLEKEMATHSSTLAWRIPWTEGLGRLQSMGSQRVGHDWATLLPPSCLNQSLTREWYFWSLTLELWRSPIIEQSGITYQTWGDGGSLPWGIRFSRSGWAPSQQWGSVRKRRRGVYYLW